MTALTISQNCLWSRRSAALSRLAEVHILPRAPHPGDSKPRAKSVKCLPRPSRPGNRPSVRAGSCAPKPLHPRRREPRARSRGVPLGGFENRVKPSQSASFDFKREFSLGGSNAAPPVAKSPLLAVANNRSSRAPRSPREVSKTGARSTAKRGGPGPSRTAGGAARRPRSGTDRLARFGPRAGAGCGDTSGRRRRRRRAAREGRPPTRCTRPSARGTAAPPGPGPTRWPGRRPPPPCAPPP